jgi:MFS family permease
MMAMGAVRGEDVGGQRRALVLIALAQLFALSLWFAASAVSDTLQGEWDIEDGRVSWLTLAVQAGFVVGALGSALSNLPDRVPTRRLFVVSALAGALANAGLLAVGSGGFPAAIALRFAVGVALAGVYPSGMKAIAGWFRRGRGTALGILVGALTVGSALPHLIRGLGLDWRAVLGGASLLAAASAFMMGAAGDGPFETRTSAFRWDHVRGLARHEGFRLATLGYLGHMWELYAAWTWVATYLVAAGSSSAPAWTFAMIAVGGPGAWLAGRLADARGRTIAAGGSMVVSGSMAALTAAVYGGPPWLVGSVLLVWGSTIVSDSAQFSAMVTEVVDDEVRGTALTLQTALGFSLTMVSIWLVPVIAAATGWRFGFVALVAGPVVGTLAMVRLRRSSWVHALAGGRG